MRGILRTHASTLNLTVVLQLPVYVPNEEEQKDPDKYSKNVRKYMVRRRAALHVPAFAVSGTL